MDALVSPDFEWLAEALLLSLALGLLLSVLVGLLMVLRPSRLFSLNERWSRWVDTSRQFSALDRPRSLERLFYRYHRISGALITLGSSYVLWQWTFAYRRDGVFGMLGSRWAQPELNWAVTAGEWITVGLHILILTIGLIILLRPSLLRSLEVEGNRWHEARIPGALDQPYISVERLLQGHPRLAGVVLLLVSTWCLTGLVPVLARLL